jgi:hypothetical protein
LLAVVVVVVVVVVVPAVLLMLCMCVCVCGVVLSAELAGVVPVGQQQADCSMSQQSLQPMWCRGAMMLWCTLFSIPSWLWREAVH